MKIEGLAAVVTGAASGLGAATAAMLSAAGARVTILDRDRETGEAQARAIAGQFIQADVTDAVGI
ncbi:SDR family NAD(P)-dependent oxidoreductase, partial [Klebsiella pneumoniae]|nr:SDR family NAD(P)-dependent oxidoreductase [Klebsiella pneumoniae]